MNEKICKDCKRKIPFSIANALWNRDIKKKSIENGISSLTKDELLFIKKQICLKCLLKSMNLLV